MFSKDAASSLMTLGQAIQPNASLDDISVFIRGTLADEVYARNACLQSSQASRGPDSKGKTNPPSLAFRYDRLRLVSGAVVSES